MTQVALFFEGIKAGFFSLIEMDITFQGQQTVHIPFRNFPVNSVGTGQNNHSVSPSGQAFSDFLTQCTVAADVMWRIEIGKK